MQEVLMRPTQIVPKQASNSYWPGFVLHGLATFFLDEDQLNLLKLALAMILPVIMAYAKVRISEMNSLVLIAAKAITVSISCGQVCRS